MHNHHQLYANLFCEKDRVKSLHEKINCAKLLEKQCNDNMVKYAILSSMEFM